MIREQLAGKHIALTGATGFLGTALLERLLLDVPIERLSVVVRGDADARLSRILGGSAFGPARERLGREGLERLAREKVALIAADLQSSVRLPEEVDVVIHAAATVSFDAPIDEAFHTNLLGAVRLCEASPGAAFVHVSTAYVAGATKGTQHEELLRREIDWRAEADAALRLRPQVEQASRRPEILERLAARARRDVGRVGPQALARRTEELRGEWIRHRLVRAGRARAVSLGWPDVYTFTKALAEIALDEVAGDRPLTIVRPSIIESAVSRPFPGWIEGFRMAEPVILAFGRGVLPEFPGIPDGVIDIIPVDLVANAILAAAAHPPDRRAVYHVCSGARNPLCYRELYEITRAYFLEHPLPDRGRGAYRVPTWSFPGRRVVERRLRRARRTLDNARTILQKAPGGRTVRNALQRLERLERRLDFMQRYADLYGAYTEAEVIYTDERAGGLFGALEAGDREDFCFDPTVFGWRRYLAEVHLPAVTAVMRAAPARRAVPAVGLLPARRPPARPVVAIFDVEGTIVASNVVETYVWLRLAEHAGASRIPALAEAVARLPRVIAADRHDRAEFLRGFYRFYAGADAATVRALARDGAASPFLRRLAPAAVRRIREHRAAGHHVIFVTGSLDFLVEPIAPLADLVVAARLRERDGVFSGDLESPPLVGEARASWLRDYARTIDADLSASYAYADSLTDLALLQAVGNPVPVNPDAALARVARVKRWPVEEWRQDPGTSRLLLPEVAG